MFYAAVGLLMVVFPSVSVAVDLANGGDEPFMAVVGIWFVLLAVGVRPLRWSEVCSSCSPAFYTSPGRAVTPRRTSPWCPTSPSVS